MYRTRVLGWFDGRTSRPGCPRANVCVGCLSLQSQWTCLDEGDSRKLIVKGFEILYSTNNLHVATVWAGQFSTCKLKYCSTVHVHGKLCTQYLLQTQLWHVNDLWPQQQEPAAKSNKEPVQEHTWLCRVNTNCGHDYHTLYTCLRWFWKEKLTQAIQWLLSWWRLKSRMWPGQTQPLCTALHCSWLWNMLLPD